jgi:hypothetical protein
MGNNNYVVVEVNNSVDFMLTVRLAIVVSIML